MEMEFADFKEKLKKLAFRPLETLLALGQELFHLLPKPGLQSQKERLQHLIQSMTVPSTLWVFDVKGVGKLLTQRLNTGKKVDPRFLLLLDELKTLPCAEEQQTISDHEHDVEQDDFKSFLRHPAKQEAIEQAVKQNPLVQAGWERIKTLFDVAPYRDERGRIYRTSTDEHRGRPDPWHYERASDKEKWLFQAFFDQFCSDNSLRGMENDSPLVEQFTVRRSIFGTHLFAPRPLKLDWLRDVYFSGVQTVHWSPDLIHGGPKASLNRLERMQMLNTAYEMNERIRTAGKQSDDRWAEFEDTVGKNVESTLRAKVCGCQK